MSKIYLQRMLENLPNGSLPPSWTGTDLSAFSRNKNLWDYQQQALQNALLALWKYYQVPGLAENERKQAYLSWYQNFGLDEDLDLPLDHSSAAKRKLSALLETYYAQVDDRLPYEQFINRMGFWMATGSGKTLVLVKMIELLHNLMKLDEIPTHDILVLAHRDDLLDQLQKHVDEFNDSGNLFIRLHELRDYAEVKHRTPSLFSNQEINVFYYRSDNLSDEKKDKIIDFRSYDNNGGWYIMLDEAHKGDKEDSKRQHIYSILSRNGFLFNFSATFTDKRDIITTAANFNLSEFVSKGYGKHILVLKQDVRAFRKGADYTDEEKQKIVLKALIMLAYTRRFEARVRQAQSTLYHRPLMMTLVNSVNTQDADLKLFFRELVRIGKGSIDENNWSSALQELLEDLLENPKFLYEEDTKIYIDQVLLRSITPADLLRDVYNATSPGEMEVIVRSSNRQEVAFKLKTSDDPFALIRIGDISDWLKDELFGYEVNTNFVDEGYFERLNRPDSDINILLGSRSFYEGWDSNRPNIITYINIGVGVDAKKFILQSVGRGVRIEPLKDQRKRLRELVSSGLLSEADQAVLTRVKNDVQALESVYIFGTNRDALNVIFGELDQQGKLTGEQELSLNLNTAAIDGKALLVPTYKEQVDLLYKERSQSKFSISVEDMGLLKRYMQYVDDDRVFYAINNIPPRQIAAMRASVMDNKSIFRTDNQRSYHNVPVLVRQLSSYFNLHNRSFSGFKLLEDEINHYKHIKVSIDHIENISRYIQKIVNSTNKINEFADLFNKNQITEDMFNSIKELARYSETYSVDYATLVIKNIANHYYVPLLLSDSERIDYIRTVIHVESEKKFLEKLDVYIRKPDNQLIAFDWWLFSRLDEKMDEIVIPYYYPHENRFANFNPDFIFWMQRGNRYQILFVDPKGTGRTEYEHKVDGYKALFEENGVPKIFKYQDMDVSVHVSLFTDDSAYLAEGYRKYWFDSIESMVKSIM